MCEEKRFSCFALCLETMAAFWMLSQLFFFKKKSNYVFIVTISKVLMEGRVGRGVQLYNCCFRVTRGLTTNTSRVDVSLQSSDIYTVSALFVIDPMACYKLSTALKSHIGLVWPKLKAERKPSAFLTNLSDLYCQFEELKLSFFGIQAVNFYFHSCHKKITFFVIIYGFISFFPI